VGEEEEERAPQIPKGTPVRSFVDRVKRATPAKPTTRKRKVSKPRVSVDNVISGFWRVLAQVAQPVNIPVARVLDMQAPVAGMLLEDLVKDTVVDRVLQPLARGAQGGELAFALLGPPLLVAAIQAKPEMQGVLVPMLKASMKTWIVVAGPKLAALEKQEEEFQELYGDRIDDLLSKIFEPVQPADE
jgi:hypothetical protein